MLFLIVLKLIIHLQKQQLCLDSIYQSFKPQVGSFLIHHDGCPRVSHGLCRHSLLSWMLREPTDVSRLSSVRGRWAIAANPCLSIYLSHFWLFDRGNFFSDW